MKRKTIKYIAAAMAASMALTACGGSTTSSDSGTTTAAAESASNGSTGAETTTAASGTDSATISVADPNASYKDTLNIAVAQQAPSLDLHKNSSLIAVLFVITVNFQVCFPQPLGAWSAACTRSSRISLDTGASVNFRMLLLVSMLFMISFIEKSSCYV